MTARSRWLSSPRATPPETSPHKIAPRQGCQLLTDCSRNATPPDCRACCTAFTSSRQASASSGNSNRTKEVCLIAPLLKPKACRTLDGGVSHQSHIMITHRPAMGRQKFPRDSQPLGCPNGEGPPQATTSGNAGGDRSTTRSGNGPTRSGKHARPSPLPHHHAQPSAARTFTLRFGSSRRRKDCTCSNRIEAGRPHGFGVVNSPN